MGTSPFEQRNSVSRSNRGRHRARSQRRIEPYIWLGAGVITLGVGGAMASGAGIASADAGDADSGSTAGASQNSAPDQPSDTGGSEASKKPDTAKPVSTIRANRVNSRLHDEDADGDTVRSTPPNATSPRRNSLTNAAFSTRRDTVTTSVDIGEKPTSPVDARESDEDGHLESDTLNLTQSNVDTLSGSLAPTDKKDEEVAPTLAVTQVETVSDTQPAVVQSSAVVPAPSTQQISQAAPGSTATAATIDSAAANASAESTLTAEMLLGKIPPTHDTLTIELIDSEGPSIPRVVVYMSGISGDGPLTPSALNAIVANLSGKQYSQVSNHIDKFIEDRGLEDAVIMLVGFSNGGQQMQYYAANGKYKSQVTTTVTFASPLVKKVDEYPEEVTPYVDTSWSGTPYVINIQAKNDPIPFLGNKDGTAASYRDENKAAIALAKTQIRLAKVSIFGWRPFGGLLAKAEADLARAEEYAVKKAATKVLYSVPGNQSYSGLDAHDVDLYKPYAAAFDASEIGYQTSQAIKPYKRTSIDTVTTVTYRNVR